MNLKIKHKIILVVYILLCSCCYSQIKIGYFSGYSCAPVSYLMENVVSINSQDAEFLEYKDSGKIALDFLDKKIDICFMPVSVAAKIYFEKNDFILCSGVTCNSNISVVTRDSSVTNLGEISNSTIYVAGENSITDQIFKFYSKNYNFIYDYSVSASTLISQLNADKIKYAVVPEPLATIAVEKKSGIHKIYEINELPSMVLVGNRDFVLENTAEFNSFLNLYQEAYEFTRDNPWKCGEFCSKYNFGTDEKILLNLIENNNYVYKTGNELKQNIEKLLNILIEFDENFCNGNLPSEDFYY